MNNYIDYYNYINNLNSNQNQMPMINSKFDFDNNPSSAFIKGNLFNNLYTPYRSFKPAELNPTDEKEYALLLVQIYGFVVHELTLYLDVNPMDSNAIKLRANYMNMYKQALAQYESRYGAIGLDSNLLNVAPWGWDSKKWPWEGNR